MKKKKRITAKQKLTDEQLAKLGITNTPGQSEKDAFFYRLYSELTLEQFALFNNIIYLNPDHIDYWIAYHAEDFDFCYEYAMKNKHLITAENYPEDKRVPAEALINSLESLLQSNVPIGSISL